MKWFNLIAALGCAIGYLVTKETTFAVWMLANLIFVIIWKLDEITDL